MIGRGLIKAKSEKLFEGDSVVDLGFQLRIGVDAEPLLEQQAFHEDKRWIGHITFSTFADRIIFYEQTFDAGPINYGVDLFHSFNGPVMFNRRKERNICEGEVGFHFLEAHRSSRLMNLKERWHKKWLKSSKIIMLSLNNGFLSGNQLH